MIVPLDFISLDASHAVAGFYRGSVSADTAYVSVAFHTARMIAVFCEKRGVIADNAADTVDADHNAVVYTVAGYTVKPCIAISCNTACVASAADQGIIYLYFFNTRAEIGGVFTVGNLDKPCIGIKRELFVIQAVICRKGDIHIIIAVAFVDRAGKKCKLRRCFYDMGIFFCTGAACKVFGNTAVPYVAREVFCFCMYG